MAFPFPLVNQRPLTGDIAMFLVLTNFLTAGWTVRTSSDGTTYKSSPGSQITNGNSGANGMANNFAWFRLQDPGGVREFVVQRNNSGLDWQWAIKYSPAAKFTGGAPAAHQVPTAADEVPILGDITGVTQTYATLWDSTPGSFALHMVMGDAAAGYAFWICSLSFATASASTSGAWFMDLVTNADTGDLDPTVHYARNTTQSFRDVASGENSLCFFASLASANFLGVRLQPWLISIYGLGVGSGQAMGHNTWNGLEDTLPMCWASTTAGRGWKGWSTLFTTFIGSSHEWGDLGSVGNPPVFGTKNYVLMGETGSGSGVTVPWPAGVDCIN